MTPRRFFIKQLLFFVWMLISCGMRKTVTGDGNPAAGATPEAITLTPVKGPVVQVECLFSKVSGKVRGTHPLQGALLCAIEAYRQAPRCAILFGEGGADNPKEAPFKGGYRCRFKVDLDQTLGLKGAGGVYYIHLACRQRRSGVIAYVPEQQQMRSSL